MSQKVDNKVTELKQKLQEADEAHTRERKEMSQKVDNKVTELKQKLQEADTRETRELLQELGNQVTGLKMDFEEKTRELNEAIQTLRGENNRLWERSLWVTMK